MPLYIVAKESVNSKDEEVAHFGNSSFCERPSQCHFLSRSGNRTAVWLAMSSFTAPLVHDTEIIQLLKNKSKIPKKDYVIIDVRDHDFVVL